MVIHLQIGSWGFVSSAAKRPFSTLSAFPGTLDKQRCSYLKNIYNIISLFRDMLTASEDEILRCLKYIYEFAETNPKHYIIYAVCRYLLFIEQPDLTVEFDSKISLDDSMRKTMTHNTAEIMVDILRPNSQEQTRKSVKNLFKQQPKQGRGKRTKKG